jgi:hypothetical protein
MDNGKADLDPGGVNCMWTGKAGFASRLPFESLPLGLFFPHPELSTRAPQ